MYEVTIHFVDGREPVGFLAAEFDVWPDARDEDNGLQRYACVAPGGERAAVCLNPGSVAAIVPAFVEPERWSGIATLEKASDRTRPVGTRRPEGEQESGAGKDPTAFRNRRKPDMADLQWGCFPRNEELEREILSFLARFGAATPRQLMRWHPLRRHFIDGEGRYSLAVERFLFSEERACDYLDAMRREGLVTSDAPHFRSRTDSVIRPTDEGAELAGMGSLPRPYVGVADAGDYYPKMVDLYQGIMGSLHEDAAWVTNRELRSAVITAARERELDRKLPSLLPSPHKFWPDAPEGVLVLKKSGTVAAVGLETTQVSKGRMAAYETIFETFSRDRALDRAYFFFVREKARLRVEKLVERHQRDGFFVFRDYRAEDPLGTSKGQHPMQTPV